MCKTRVIEFNIKKNQYFPIYTNSLPWNEDTFTGWFYTFLYSTLFAAAGLILNAYFLSSFVTICVQFHSFRLHFEKILSKMDTTSVNDSEYIVELNQILCSAIKFHKIVKS